MTRKIMTIRVPATAGYDGVVERTFAERDRVMAAALKHARESKGVKYFDGESVVIGSLTPPTHEVEFGYWEVLVSYNEPVDGPA